MIMSTDCHGSCRDGVEDLLGLEWICVSCRDGVEDLLGLEWICVRMNA
jgi:hypothetical protein